MNFLMFKVKFQLLQKFENSKSSDVFGMRLSFDNFQIYEYSESPVGGSSFVYFPLDLFSQNFSLFLRLSHDQKSFQCVPQKQKGGENHAKYIVCSAPSIWNMQSLYPVITPLSPRFQVHRHRSVLPSVPESLRQHPAPSRLANRQTAHDVVDSESRQRAR